VITIDRVGKFGDGQEPDGIQTIVD
jgi:hypothetical protein